VVKLDVNEVFGREDEEENVKSSHSYRNDILYCQVPSLDVLHIAVSKEDGVARSDQPKIANAGAEALTSGHSA